MGLQNQTPTLFCPLEFSVISMKYLLSQMNEAGNVAWWTGSRQIVWAT